MVARINQGEVVRGAVEYNERKVADGKAKLIYAENYLKSADELSFHEKLGMLEKLASLNDTRKIKCVHISLNFDPSEKPDPKDEAATEFWREKVSRIAKEYMELIGFKGQPFLVYEHNDAAHPHIHIVTTNIKPNRKSVDLRWIGKHKSEPARKALEEKYNLVRASKKDISQHNGIPPINIEKIVYAEIPTKRAITNVVGEVIRSYNFTSLTEYNEILKQFNVIADTGPEGSKMRKNNGLVYYVLNGLGKQIGNGIKASSLYKTPTLSNLELTFKEKKVERKHKLDRTRNIINRILSSTKTTSRKTFVEQLNKVGIKAIFKDTKDGRAYGLTFIDNVNRLAIKGSDLGMDYSVNAITRYLIDKPTVQTKGQSSLPGAKATSSNTSSNSSSIRPHASADINQSNKQDAAALQILGELLQYEMPNYQPDPYKKKKRKKKKGLHL